MALRDTLPNALPIIIGTSPTNNLQVLQICKQQ
jgi:hypothetical protein